MVILPSFRISDDFWQFRLLGFGEFFRCSALLYFRIWRAFPPFCYSTIPSFRLLGQPNGNILQSFGHLNVLYSDCVKLMTPQVRREGTGRARTGRNGNGRDGGS